MRYVEDKTTASFPRLESDERIETTGPEIPVIGNPHDAPTIFVDNLFNFSQIADIVRLNFIQNYSVPGTSQYQGHYVANLVMPMATFRNTVDYLNRVIDQLDAQKKEQGGQ